MEMERWKAPRRRAHTQSRLIDACIHACVRTQVDLPVLEQQQIEARALLRRGQVVEEAAAGEGQAQRGPQHCCCRCCRRRRCRHCGPSFFRPAGRRRAAPPPPRLALSSALQPARYARVLLWTMNESRRARWVRSSRAEEEEQETWMHGQAEWAARRILVSPLAYLLEPHRSRSRPRLSEAGWCPLLVCPAACLWDVGSMH